MIHSVLLVARGTETTLLSRFYGAAERSSALLQAQWLQSVRDATKARWGLARHGGGEQIAVCQDKCVVYAGTQELLVFVAGTDEYDELALLGIVSSVWSCLCGALLPKPSEQLTEALITENYHVACLVLDEMFNQGILEHTDPEIVRKSLKLKFKKDMAF